MKLLCQSKTLYNIYYSAPVKESRMHGSQNKPCYNGLMFFTLPPNPPVPSKPWIDVLA